VRAENTSEPATISVDGAAPVSLPQPSLCLSGAESDALQNAMMSGQSVTIQAGFYPKGPAKTMALPRSGCLSTRSIGTPAITQAGIRPRSESGGSRRDER